MRYALYFTPPPGSALDRFGSAAIGYDAATGEDVPFLDLGIPPERLSAATADPRRYGFHATLKAPFRLAQGCDADALLAALRAFAGQTPPVTLARLVPRALGPFVALVPGEPSTALQLLAAECVAVFDAFRAPLSPEDRAKRLKGGGLAPRHAALLERWGYPYVFDAFRFHMTLTGALPDEAERAAHLAALQAAYAPLAAEPVVIDAVSLLRQESGEARFRLVARVPLTGSPP